MKNKRKCKNKYTQNKPEGEVNKAEPAEKHKPYKEVRTESYSSNSEKISKTPVKGKEKEHKPQKREKTEEGTDISCPTGPEKQIEKENKTEGGKGATQSSADASKQKAEEPKEITDDQQQLPVKRPKPELSREQSLKRERLQKMLRSRETDRLEAPAETKDEPAAPEVEEVKRDRSASLRSRMEHRLESARFRYINEVLYSTSSGDAKRMFKQDPQAFWIYHRGYTAQVQRWPANPVDDIISFIRQR